MIILASKSTGRLATLRAAGVEPRVEVSSVDEGAILAALAQRRAEAGEEAPSPAEQVLALATAKALDVASAFGEGASAAGEGAGPSGTSGRASAPVVVGCDSMLEIDGAVVGKPRTPEAARERWLAMRGFRLRGAKATRPFSGSANAVRGFRLRGRRRSTSSARKPTI